MSNRDRTEIEKSMAWFKDHDSRLNCSRIVAGTSEYKHSFGGAIVEIEPLLAKAPIHVLFSLDLKDPLLHYLKLGGERLPLVFPLTVDGGEIAYACTPSGGIRLFGKLPRKASPDWPNPDYPTAFPKIPVQILELTYEEYRASQFCYQLGPADWLREDDRAILEGLGDSFTQLGGVQELPFGEPFVQSCPNPKCPRHAWPHGMEVFLSVWNEPLPGVVLWYDGADVLIAFSICKECKAIRACTMMD